jgi:hypothetical protein
MNNKLIICLRVTKKSNKNYRFDVGIWRLSGTIGENRVWQSLNNTKNT